MKIPTFTLIQKIQRSGPRTSFTSNSKFFTFENNNSFRAIQINAYHQCMLHHPDVSETFSDHSQKAQKYSSRII